MTDEIFIEELGWTIDPIVDPILKEITVLFKECGFYGVLGPNGSGKTSLIRHIMRFLPIKEGKVQYGDTSIRKFKRKDLATKLSFVPQNVALELDFSVEEVVAMGRLPHLKRFEELTKRDYDLVEEALNLSNCKELRGKPFSTLSGGEAQRVLVARAIAQDTKWIILDEPISHLDIHFQVELMETLKYLNKKKGKSILLILHDLNMCSSFCKEVLLMKSGKIYAQGKVKEVLTKENLKEVYQTNFEILEYGNSKRLLFVPKLQQDL